MTKPKLISRPRSRLTAPRALAEALLAANGYVFTEKNHQADRQFRRHDARAILKALRRSGFLVIRKPRTQP